MFNYNNFREERENFLNCWQCGRGYDIDSGIRNFLIDFNKLPFVYSLGWTHSGLIEDNPYLREWALRLNTIPLDGGFYFSFAFNTRDEKSGGFLENLKLANVEKKDISHIFKRGSFWDFVISECIPFRPVYTGGFIQVRRKYHGTRNLTYISKIKSASFFSGKRNPEEFESLRKRQIDNVHNIILKYLEN
ncbi:hypothetical protein J4474_03480 [Candidatus Pacearchaeota archaeon]|nr:hypothetical protein [Candidatus Pacearchaeota archaeon]